MSPWAVLGIEACGDVKQIKRAYLARLKHCHPEDDQQAFIELKQAYDQALNAAAYYEQADQAPPSRPPASATESLPAFDGAEVFSGNGEGYMDDMLDGFVRYSDIGAARPESPAGDVEIDFAAEYESCIGELARILGDEAISGDGDAWQSLFEREILLNLSCRQQFCGELLDRLQAYLELVNYGNQMTPRIILLINDFIGQTQDIEKSFYISDVAMVILSGLATEAERHVARASKTKKSFIDKLFWLLWLYFSPIGRINRVVFTAAWALPLLGILLLLSLPGAMFDAFAAENADPLSLQSDQYLGLELDSSVSSAATERSAQVLNEELKMEMAENDAEIKRMAEELRYQREAEEKRRRYQSQWSFIMEELQHVDFAEMLLSLGRVLLIIALIWSFLGVTVKRLHDTGRSMISVIIIIVPVIGPLLFVLIMYANSEKSDNKYGAFPGRKARNLKQFRILVYESFAAVA